MMKSKSRNGRLSARSQKTERIKNENFQLQKHEKNIKD